jgi:hypothetical protein
MIGVYKRALRVALELVERGNQVVLSCSGREHFHDHETARAEERMTFLDIPFRCPAHEQAQRNRTVFLKCLADSKPDVVVIGESPLSGPMLEATLCAAELEIPLVCLDNAYGGFFTKVFCRHHGGLFDGIILTGPSSSYLEDAPDYVLQVPPYIRPSASQASRLLTEKLRLDHSKLAVILAYDRNVETLGLSLLRALNEPNLSAVFVGAEAEEIEQRLGTLPPHIRERVRAIAPQPDGTLFGLLQLAQVAIVKLGFMQVTECLSLRTPVVGLYFPGQFSTDFLPGVCRSFIHATTETAADPDAVAALRGFLQANHEELAVLHDGQFNAVERAADYLEALPLVVRQEGMSEHAAQYGFTKGRIQEALKVLEGGEQVEVHDARCLSLRGMPSQRVFQLTSNYWVDGSRRFARLWGRLFPSQAAANTELERSAVPGSRRQVLYVSDEDRVVVERDIGEALLPSSQECMRMGIPYLVGFTEGALKEIVLGERNDRLDETTGQTVSPEGHDR